MHEVVTFFRDHARLIARVFTRQLNLEQSGRNKSFGSSMLQDSGRSELPEIVQQCSDVALILDGLKTQTAGSIASDSDEKSQISDHPLGKTEQVGGGPSDRESNKISTNNGLDSRPNFQNEEDFIIKSVAFAKLCANFQNFMSPPLRKSESRTDDAEREEQLIKNTKTLDSNLNGSKSAEPGAYIRGANPSISPAREIVPAMEISEKISTVNIPPGESLEAPHELEKPDTTLEATEHTSLLENSEKHVAGGFQAERDRIGAFGTPLMPQSRSNSEISKASISRLGSPYWGRSFAGMPSTLEPLRRRWEKFFRPEVQPGYRRIQWTCDCGEEMYGDFENSEPRAVDSLVSMLQNTTVDSESCEVPMPDLPSPSSSAEANPKNTSQVGSAETTALVTNTEGSVTPPSDRVSSTVAKPPDSSYLALCVNTGEFKKSLVEIEVSKVTSDGELFQLMKTKYREVRGFRARLSFLIKPVSIRFVHFNLFNLRGGYVGLCEMDKPWSIPPVDVRDYKYAPVPLKPLPPMPAEVFLHYFQYGDVDNAHRASHWLHRLPTRVKARIIDHPQIPVWGWGIYVVEGPNRPAIFWVTIVTIFASALAAMIWSWLHGDIQGGTALGSLIIAMPTAVMAAFLFKLG